MQNRILKVYKKKTNNEKQRTGEQIKRSKKQLMKAQAIKKIRISKIYEK